MSEAPAPEKRKATFKPVLWGFLFTVILVAFPGMIILIGVGMLPTIVAKMVDRSDKKYAAFCVGGMNFAGVFPWIMDLGWQGARDFGAAFAIITDPFKLTMMYAAAAFGWLLFVSIPPVVAALISIAAQQRIMQLRAKQRELINEWGQNIAQGQTEIPEEAGEEPAET